MKQKKSFLCQNCGYRTPRWVGCCPECEQWNTLSESIDTPAAKQSASHTHRTFMLPEHDDTTRLQPLSAVNSQEHPRIITGITEFDRTIGGGLVPGSVSLLGGEPGIGKSTLVLQVLDAITKKMPASEQLLYVSGEESASQISIRAKRLGINSPQIMLYSETAVEKITQQIQKLMPQIVIIDSIQTIYRSELNQSPGTLTQVRESAASLIYLAKSLQVAIILIGHVTKDGNIAGPRVLEHMVDAVLYMEGDNNYTFRILRAIKNRFGSVGELGIFTMEETGLCEVKNPSELFLGGHKAQSPGSSIAAVIEGSRSLLIEVQALVAPCNYSSPQRVSHGVDPKRLAVILAVLTKRLDYKLQNYDVFINIPGGIKISEPALDYALAAAIKSAYKNQPVQPKTIFIGEIGLCGELRSVPYINQRLKEAARLGFEQAVIPAQSKLSQEYGLKITRRESL